MPGSTFSSTTDWFNNPTYRANFPASMSSGGGSAVATMQSLSGPAYDRTSSIPSWLPTPDNSKLESEYADTGKAYDTNPFDVASGNQQSRVLTTALNAGNNAATEYTNRARQAGGSAQGAGLVKAEAQVGARATAGQMEIDRAKFDAEMRDKAATHSAAIATTLAGLRQDYLKTIVGYATSEDSVSATNRQTALDAAKLDEQKREFDVGQRANSSWFGFIPTGPGGSGPTGQGGYAYNARAGISSRQDAAGNWNPSSWGG